MSITLDGTSNANLGFRILEDSLDPILPQTEDRTLSIPGKNGLYDFGADYFQKEFIFSCAFVDDGTDFTAPSASELQRMVRRLSAFLTNSQGKPQNLKLIFTREPDKHYTVRLSGKLDVQRIIQSSIGTFSLPLIAFDPHAYALIEAYDVAYLYDTGFLYNTGLIYPNARTVQDWSFLAPSTIVPIGSPRIWAGFVWNYATHFSSQHNYGTVETPLIVRISGNVTNPTITNNTNGGTMTIATTLVNQTLLVDGKRKIVTIDGVNALQYLTGDFVSMDVGENLFTFTGTAPYATVTYQWLNKFI